MSAKMIRLVHATGVECDEKDGSIVLTFNTLSGVESTAISLGYGVAKDTEVAIRRKFRELANEQRTGLN